MTARIDSHQHFWSYSKTEYPWIPEGSALQATWLPRDLEAIQKDLGFTGSIAVQARQCLEENKMLLDLADRHASVLGVVGWVNLRSEHVDEELAEFSAHKKFVGVRHVAQDEPDDWFLVGSEFLRGVGRLSTFGLRYDLLIYPRQLPAAIELARHFPEQPFVLDHCAKPQIAAGTMEPWASQIKELAIAPNVYCKVSGLVTEANHSNWESEKLRAYFATIAEAFGPERLMWGSDWPVCLLASSYERWLETAESWVRDWSSEQREAFFGGNARKFYGLRA